MDGLREPWTEKMRLKQTKASAFWHISTQAIVNGTQRIARHLMRGIMELGVIIKDDV